MVLLDFPVGEKKIAKLRLRMKSLKVTEEDLKEQFIRSSGPGGQKVNKSHTCVLLTYAKENIQIKYEKERTQGLNRFFARRILCEQLEKKRGIETDLSKKIKKFIKQKKRRKAKSKKKNKTSCQGSCQR